MQNKFFRFRHVVEELVLHKAADLCRDLKILEIGIESQSWDCREKN